MSRILSFDYETRIDFSAAVTDHSFLLRCVPASFPGQRVIENEIILKPAVSYSRRTDAFGNTILSGIIQTPHEHFSYRSRGIVELDNTLVSPSDAMPIYRFPSKYTAMSGEMAALLNAQLLPAADAERAEIIMKLTHEHMSYLPGSTGLKTTAAEAFSKASGVCQDYAHIFLALARSTGLTARYVNGIRDGLCASHAWCEVWLDGVWHGFDPTENRRTDESYIRFGVGRDYADCPIERGVFKGCAVQAQTIILSCRE